MDVSSPFPHRPFSFALANDYLSFPALPKKYQKNILWINKRKFLCDIIHPRLCLIRLLYYVFCLTKLTIVTLLLITTYQPLTKCCIYQTINAGWYSDQFSVTSRPWCCFTSIYFLLAFNSPFSWMSTVTALRTTTVIPNKHFLSSIERAINATVSEMI